MAKFIDENDSKSHEIALNFLNFVKNIAEVSDEQKKRIEDEEKKYNLDLAVRGDLLDENLDKLEEKFSSKVEELTRSVTGPDLENFLNESIRVLEEIAMENRKYTEEASEMLSFHPYKIINSYLVYLVNVLEKFGLLSIDKKEEVIANKRKNETMKLKTPEENQKRTINAKDQIENKSALEIKEVTVQGRKFIVFKGITEIIKEIMITEDEKEKELIRKQKEEEKKKEEERKALEEAIKREEAKKLKAKPSTIKPEEIKKEEIILPPAEAEIEEPSVPVDPEGNPCLLDSLDITAPYLSSLFLAFQSNISNCIAETESSLIKTSKEADKTQLENIQHELDEKLRFLWPRKGKLEVNEFSTRSIEIKRHFNR